MKNLNSFLNKLDEVSTKKETHLKSDNADNDFFSMTFFYFSRVKKNVEKGELSLAVSYLMDLAAAKDATNSIINKALSLISDIDFTFLSRAAECSFLFEEEKTETFIKVVKVLAEKVNPKTFKYAARDIYSFDADLIEFFWDKFPFKKANVFALLNNCPKLAAKWFFEAEGAEVTLGYMIRKRSEYLDKLKTAPDVFFQMLLLRGVELETREFAKSVLKERKNEKYK